MGLATILAAGVTLLIILTASYSLTQSLSSLSQAVSYSAAIVASREVLSLRSSIKVLRVEFVEVNVVRIEAINDGSIGIPESKFRLMDVIILYTDVNGNEVAEYLKYSIEGDPGTWRVKQVITSNEVGESLNPICPCPDAGKGVWDPLEVLVIEAFLRFEGDQTLGVNALVSSPWGSYGYG